MTDRPILPALSFHFSVDVTPSPVNKAACRATVPLKNACGTKSPTSRMNGPAERRLQLQSTRALKLCGGGKCSGGAASVFNSFGPTSPPPPIEMRPGVRHANQSAVFFVHLHASLWTQACTEAGISPHPVCAQQSSCPSIE